ncbi:hypothetical protein B0O99DRAFT_561917 [Bisporella sp. PMI_857]|nr:hypothetical protein B0O99DRAFT_561917 [Bisporella sp. PMI_857]
MGKNKRLKRLQANNKPARSKAHGTKPAGIAKSKSRPISSKPHIQPSQQIPIIPFEPTDRILLVGEGDLSFARSLVEHHACTNLKATVYEPREELETKYPHVAENITVIESGGGEIKYSVDATKIGPAWRDLKGKVDRVIFNFPHVGGKSKDVNRQVRYNQAELLVSFFRTAQTVLCPSSAPKLPPSIIVTLFEGEPYTLWNVKDLGRHAGLQVERSFVFQAKAYEGYRHARTLGIVRAKDGEEGGGWRGEERAARSFVFVRKGEATMNGEGSRSKRKRDADTDDDSYDGENYGDAVVSEDEEEEKGSQSENGNQDDDQDSEAWDGFSDSSQERKSSDGNAIGS